MTPAPRSIAEIAQIPMAPATFDNAVLVIVDAQLEYVAGKLPLFGIDGAIAEISSLLALARRHRAPVFHIVQHSRSGGVLFDPNGAFVAIVPELTPIAGEEVIVKALPNAFAGTALQARIQESGRKEILLVGFMTHNCIAATAEGAVDLGYRTTIVAKAAATRDLPDPLGGAVAADTLHRSVLAGLADRIAIVVPDAAALGAAMARSA